MTSPTSHTFRVWGFLSIGLAAAGILMGVRPLPLAPGRWPASGAFGAFTWGAWFVSTVLAAAGVAGLVALALVRPRPRGGTPRRVARATVGFGLTALGAYAAAAHAERLARQPLATLGLVVLTVFTWRVLNGRRTGVAN